MELCLIERKILMKKLHKTTSRCPYAYNSKERILYSELHTQLHPPFCIIIVDIITLASTNQYEKTPTRNYGQLLSYLVLSICNICSCL